ncbi:L-methionine/branched-chain amino acid transporter [Oceanospirillum sediminis]|uniref:L-methionine/branched-chain amino acid transporter n=1 Tax=Oceanospirillum sediminis TaxID=2760088 RepID=A0A839IWI9_9GAMM|nr:L-methionine/branched-chain amino acid transporter [Oceanospirillum sediminis]MBB1489132.1 L-methionine/branched-chain amino acid transporter [Oceanospirillum sediminis]
MTRLNQTITRWQGMGLIATTLLGTGVFILPQLTLQAAGDKAIWAWGFLLLAILPLTLVFAELGRHYTHAAGPAYFTEKAFGALPGRVIGLIFLFAIPPGVAGALIMTFEFLKPLISLTPFQTLMAELGVFLSLFMVNRKGLQLSGRIQLGLTLVILSVVSVMLTSLLLSSDIQPSGALPVVTDTQSGILAAISLAVWSFLGIEAVTHLAGEFKDVKKDFIPACLGGVALVGLIYMACTWLSMLNPENDLAMVGAFSLLLGDGGRWIIGILGLISGFATLNVYLASTSRLAWSFSNEGILPAAMKQLNQYQVPSVALISFISISSAMLILSYLFEMNFVSLAHWVNGCFVMIYTVSMLAAWKLLSARHRPAIVAGLAACLLFIYSLGEAMSYSIILAMIFVPGLMLQQKFKVRISGQV